MAATSKNDKVILQLQKQVEVKRAAIKKSEKFAPITNCSIDLDGRRCNIQTLQKPELMHLLVVLNSCKNSAKELGLLEDYTMSGFKVTDWLIDLQAKLANLTRKEEEAKLRVMEDKLTALLSNDTKVALELEKIQKSLQE